ncbi:MAG: NHL repeat-containing protein [Verrucomicrobiae bacterium]|nr:NHL repeat-containing protein [Verrucomicrobiae bacterium]
MKLPSLFLFTWLVLLPGVASVDAGESWRIGPSARLVLGQADFTSNAEGSGLSGMARPSDIAVDPTTGKVFVVDYVNNRILRFAAYAGLQNGAAPEAVLGQPDFDTNTTGGGPAKLSNPRQATVDHEGRLWVSDTLNGRVLRFDSASQKASGGSADGVLGQSGFFAADSPSSRSVMEYPFGLAVDGGGTLFVSESFTHRVLAFRNAAMLDNGANASFVLGQTNFSNDASATTRDGMNGPRGLAVDAEGNLFVADTFNHRILRFDDAANKTNGSDADSVIGQTNFSSNQVGTSAERFWAPWDVAVDGEGRLWVADLWNNRIIGFSNAILLGALPTADQLIGHETFSSLATGLSDRELDSANFDPMTNQDNSLGVGAGLDGLVWVADSGNHRVLAFTKDSHFPDMRIGLKSSATRGNNVHNSGGAGQTQAYAIKNGKKARLYARLENDGNVDDSYSLKGLGSNSRFKIAVFLVTGGRRNVTASVKSGAYRTELQIPGSSLVYQHEIRPKGKEKSKRGTIRAWLQATSTTDSQVDRVVSLVKNRPK